VAENRVISKLSSLLTTIGLLSGLGLPHGQVKFETVFVAQTSLDLLPSLLNAKLLNNSFLLFFFFLEKKSCHESKHTNDLRIYHLGVNYIYRAFIVTNNFKSEQGV